MHRHPIECIVPPYILEAIKANGNARQQAWAEATLQLSSATRDQRPPPRAVDVRPPLEPRLSGGLTSTATRKIYDAKESAKLPGTLVRGDADPPVADAAVNEAYDGLGATLKFYADAYARDSIDGQGLALIASVHYSTKYDNAQWTGSQMLFGDGDGTIFNRFTIAIDVMGHELTHGVTQYSGGMVYQSQSGALNESMSDVFGSMVKQYHASPRQTAAEADWLIGAGLFAPGINGVALRSMKAPGTAYDDPMLGKDPQPATMAGYVTTASDNGGVHTNSGIPNHAFYLTAVGFGGFAWEKAGQIWYEVLIDPSRSGNLSFSDFAARTYQKALELFGPDGGQVLRNAWREVGVPVGVPWQAAFQANNGDLSVVGTADNRGDTKLGMMAGTSPSIAFLSSGGWQVAFQANTGNLWVIGTLDDRGDTKLGMMAGTSPSIALLPNGGWQVAFQANDGNLWVIGTLDNRGNTKLGMMAGTSPSIALLPNGGWQVAFQANTGSLWVIGTLDDRGEMDLGMMAGTSPSIALLPNGGWQVAFQANDGTLWVIGTLDNRGNTKLGMMAGTSPSIALLPNGGWQVAFQANTGSLWVIGTLDNRGELHLGMMAGTSPSIALLPNGSWQVAFQANTGTLWVVGTNDNPGDLNLRMSRTSPSI